MSVLTRLLVPIFVVATAAHVLAADVVVKLATQAPANTTWHKALTRHGRRVERRTRPAA